MIHRKFNFLFLLSLPCLMLSFQSCTLLRGLFLETEAVAIAGRLRGITATEGFALERSILTRTSSVRAGVVGGRVVSATRLSGAEIVLELQNFETVIANLNRVRVGNIVNRSRSLYVVENGKNVEVARALGVTRNSETIVQLYFENKAISKPFTLPGRLYTIASDEALLYTGRGLNYRVYEARIPKGSSVFLLEEIKAGWAYIQFQNFRGYIPAEYLLSLSLADISPGQPILDSLYVVDEKGTGSVCFTNYTDERVAVVFAQSDTTYLEESGPGNFANPILVLNPDETACVFNLPVSLRYQYQVSKVPVNAEKTLGKIYNYLYKPFDKGEISITNKETQYYPIKINKTKAEIDGLPLNDNSIYQSSKDIFPKGDLGFKNHSSKRIAVFLCETSENDERQSGPGNYSAPEIFIAPGETKFFYHLKNGASYHYSVYYKENDNYSRDASNVYERNYISGSKIRINKNDPFLMEIGKIQREKISIENIKNNEIVFVNNTGKDIAVFLCTDPYFGCSNADYGSEWAIIKSDQSFKFAELKSNVKYAYAVYFWDKNPSRHAILTNLLITTKEFSSLIQNPKIVTIKKGTQFEKDMRDRLPQRPRRLDQRPDY